MPSALPTITRRRLLVGALPATMALTVLASVAACAPALPPAELAELVAEFNRAHADSLLAGEAATTARPQIAPMLTTVASERAAHARALSDEITRLTGGDTPTATPTTTTQETRTPPTTTGSPPPTAAPTVADVVAALHASADSATRLATRLSGYRAGLLGSIAAACTAAYLVALAGPGPAR